jgi:hypothetical protein
MKTKFTQGEWEYLLSDLEDEVLFLTDLLSQQLEGKYRITDEATRSTMNGRISVLKQSIKKATS